jgi:hypothetical protein
VFVVSILATQTGQPEVAGFETDVTVIELAIA